MATTIQDFFTRAASKQFSRDFLFRVRQIDLVGNPGIIRFNGEDELVYAKTAALPGRNIENKLVNYFGQEFQVPGRAIYQNAAGYSIDFYHDENCDIRNKLEAASRAVWAGVTDNEATESKGAYGMPGNESVIILSQIDKQLREVKQIQLVGASIRDIGEISYTIAEGTGEVLTYNVTFAYHFYRDFSRST